MATLNKFDAYGADLHNGAHNLASDQLKVTLTNTLTVAGSDLFADMTGVLAASGFTAAAITSAFRYVVKYNGTVAGSPLIGWRCIF